MQPHQMTRFVLFALLTFSHLAESSGYRIPENSVNSTALSAAYVANAHGADAAYFNPAAMVFNEDRNMIEGNITYIYLSPIDFAGATTESSEKQNFFIPSFHYSSRAFGKVRFGLSVDTPAGLTKRWRGTSGIQSSEKFSLKTVEINPSVAYQFSDHFSAALGLRAIYSEGIVRSTAGISRDMTGDGIDYGYNLAFLYKPSSDLSLAATYRSNIDLNVKGNARILLGAATVYNSSASVSVPVPASLALATAFKLDDQTTLEFTLERTFWSKYKELDFLYNINLTTIHPALAAFELSPKNWKDSDAFRIGLTHQYNNQWTVMAGYAYDQTPAPKSTTGFELPDSNAHLFSAGARYQMTKDTNIGAAFLYDYKKDRYSTNSNGRFSNASALLATFGIEVLL